MTPEAPPNQSAVVVIGGGLAGGAAACALAQAGHAVELIERSTGPHDKVCGEFLSIEAQGDLARLGIDAGRLGGVTIDRVRLVHRGRTAESPLPFHALSLSRRVLDEALLTQATRAGVTVRRGVAARGVQTDAGSGIARLTGQDGPAPTLVLATGKHGLRGAARAAAGSGLIGFKMYFRLAAQAEARLANCVELHLFAGGYAGVEPVEDGRANLTLLVRQARYAALGADWGRLLAALRAENPSLDALLAGATPMLDRPLSVAGIPYGFVHRPGPADPRNLYRVGDQLAVIPSLTGDGMSVALRSGLAAAAAIHRGEPPARFHARYRRDSRRQMRTAGVLAAALQSRAGAAMLTAAAAAAPGLIGWAARATRLAGETRSTRQG